MESTRTTRGRVVRRLQIIENEALRADLEAARRALAPIDELRAATGRRGSARGASKDEPEGSVLPEETPDAPLPELTAQPNSSS